MKTIDMEGLLLTLVAKLVSSFADELVEPNEALRMEAHLYRVLAATCERRAEMGEGMAKEMAKALDSTARGGSAHDRGVRQNGNADTASNRRVAAAGRT